MPQISHSVIPLAKKRERFVSKPNPYQLARLLAPSLFAMAFATAAHAQGTMDFSGAQTLMSTFITVTSVLMSADTGGVAVKPVNVGNPPSGAIMPDERTAGEWFANLKSSSPVGDAGCVQSNA